MIADLPNVPVMRDTVFEERIRIGRSKSQGKDEARNKNVFSVNRFNTATGTGQMK